MVSPVAEKDLRAAIAVLVRRKHDGAQEGEWPAVIAEMKEIFGVTGKVVKDVLNKIAEDVSPADRRPGAGRKPRVEPGTQQADMIVGGLLDGWGVRRTTRIVNTMGRSPGEAPLSLSTVHRTAQEGFGLIVSKRKFCKTGSRDKNSEWARSRLPICTQFRGDIRGRRALLEQTLFVDEHSEFIVLGRGAHHGASNRHEWRAHRDADGNVCRPEDGGVLQPQVPQPKPKHPGRADGLFGVAATYPLGGRRKVGRRMTPLRYRGRVVGIKQYDRLLEAEFERVRKLGRDNRANLADPNKRARAGAWLRFADEENPYEVCVRDAPSYILL